MIETVLFDLDGTLLPLYMDEFVGEYFRLLKKSGALDVLGADGYLAYMAGFEAICSNDGSQTNMNAFCSRVERLCGVSRRIFLPAFDEFFRGEFAGLKKLTFPRPDGAEAVRLLRKKGYGVVLATAPVFPRVATLARLGWTGLCEDDFHHITTYENSRYNKPNLGYYRELVKKLKLNPQRCVMVGNSVDEDLVAMKLGFEGFYVSEFGLGNFTEGQCLEGDLSAVLKWAQNLPDRPRSII